MKYLVIVNSATNVISGLVNFNHKRSFYTNAERFSQTVETLKNIRKTIPNAMVIFAEGTNLYPNQITEYNKYVDILLECGETLEVQEAVKGTSKSLGEATTMLYAINFVIENNIEYDMMFKICARNQFDEKFVLENFNMRNKFYFRMFKSSHNEWYSTVMYAIGRECLALYKGILENAIPLLKQGCWWDIETALRKLVPKDNIIIVEAIGVTGTLGSHGEPFSH